MKQLIVLVLILSGLPLMTGCSSQSNAQDVPSAIPPEAQFYSLHSGAPIASSSKSQKVIKVLETQQDYVTTLAEYSNDAPKAVDFSKGRVLVVARGWAPTPGDGIQVSSVDVRNTYVVANVELTVPGCAQAQVLSYPYQFVFIPTTKTILFSEKMVTYACP